MKTRIYVPVKRKDYPAINPITEGWILISSPEVMWLKPVEISEEGIDGAKWAAKYIRECTFTSVLDELSNAYEDGAKAIIALIKGEG